MKKMSCKLQAAFYCHLLETDTHNFFYMGNAFEMSIVKVILKIKTFYYYFMIK